MKKTMFLAIMAGAALAGCVKNEEVVQSDGSPELITFEAPVVSVPTRATEIYGNYPKDKDFSVFARYYANDYTSFNDGTPYMNDVKCTANKQGTAEAPETPDYWAPFGKDYYWPKNGSLTFAAYAPSSVAATWGETGFTFTDFTVDDDPTQQFDLLYSERVYDKTASSMATNAPYDGITIPFQHALSSIIFAAKTEGDYSSTTTIKLTSIKVNNVVKKGTFAQNLTAGKDGDSDGNKPAWTYDATNTANVKDSYTVYSSAGGLEIGSTEKFVNGEPDEIEYNFTGDQPAAPAPAVPNSYNGVRRSDLILIPQELDREGSNNDVTVTIEYTMNGISQPAATFKLGVKDKAAVWEMGKRYIYHITIGLQKIYFNPQVTNWEDVPGSMDIVAD